MVGREGYYGSLFLARNTIFAKVHNPEGLEAIAKHESLDRAVCGAEGIATCLNISSTLFHGCGTILNESGIIFNESTH